MSYRGRDDGRPPPPLAPAGRIVGIDGSLCEVVPGRWTPLATFDILRDIERPDVHGRTLVARYAARFHIALLFRARKQCLGDSSSVKHAQHPV